MKISLTCLILCLFCVVSLSAADFDRAACHQARLTGLDLSCRDAISSPIRQVVPSSASFSDLRLSQSVSPTRFNQDNSRVICLADSSWLVVWNDNRRGSDKIFWQRFDISGELTGPNEQIAGSVTGANYVDPLLDIDDLGRVYLFYRDRTNGLIYGSRYTADLQTDLAPFIVNDTSSECFAGPFDMAVFPDGQMVIVWENYSSFGSTIEMRLYSPSGNPLDNPVTVNSDGVSVQHWVPSVAVAPGSGFLVLWEDYRNGRADIYARQYSGSGSPMAGEFVLVPPPDDAADQYTPEVTYSSKDKYVAGWIDTRAGQEIYLQRFDQITGLVGDNQLISSGDVLISNWDIHLSVTESEKLKALWSLSGADNSILSLELDSGLQVTGSAAAMNLSHVGQRWDPAVWYDADNRRAMVWTEVIGDDANIHFMLFDSLNTRLLGAETKVNDDLYGGQAVHPFVIASTDWYDLVSYADRRNDAGDIYMKAVSNSGHPFDGEMRVNQDIGSSLQSEPAMAVSAAKALTVWIDGRMVQGVSGQRIYGRFSSLYGELAGENEFMISDTTATAIKSSPRAVMNADGRGLVVWADGRNDSLEVWGRWLNSDGSLDGDEFSVSNSATDSSATDLCLAVDTSGRFYVVWLDIGTSEYTVKGRIYNADKSAADSLVWSSSLSGVSVDELAVDVSADGHVILLWTGAEGGVRNTYLTELTANGTVLTAPTEISDDPDADASEPAVSIADNGYVSAAWVDQRTGTRKVYYQIFDDGLSAVGTNQPVSVAGPEFMISPATDTRDGRSWFLWVAPDNEGLHVWASSLVYLTTDADEDEPPNLPHDYSLEQNYPNPFNPSTVISFTLPERSAVTLTVYDVLGRQVASLVNAVLPAGEHTITWNGTVTDGQPAASGVYLYRLRAGTYTAARKMLLLK